MSITVKHPKGETFDPAGVKSTRLRADILNACKAANIDRGLGIPLDELLLTLIFRTEEELVRIARRLHLSVDVV